VAILNCPGYNSPEVSIHAIALLLSCVRKIPRLAAGTANGDWPRELAKPLFRISGRTIGLLGFGNAARSIRAKLSGFDLDVIAYDPFVVPEVFEEHGVEQVELSSLASQSDYLSIHVPLTDSTRNLVDAEFLGRMKQSAILVNTSRGEVVDMDALHTALETGEIRGAGLDVLPSEPPANMSIAALQSVVVTPHVAGYSEDARREVRRRGSADLVAFFRGEQLEGLVNEDAIQSSDRSTRSQ